MVGRQDGEQKKQVIQGITSVMVKLGIPAEATHVIIKDNPKSNWGTAGKQCSEE